MGARTFAIVVIDNKIVIIWFWSLSSVLRRPVSKHQRTYHSFLETLPGYLAHLEVDIESGRHLDEENLEWGVRTDALIWLG